MCYKSTHHKSQNNSKAVRSTRKRAADTCKAEKWEQERRPRLTAPLSTRGNYESVKNIAGWVQRSKEVREREKAERHGFIPRPLNSFMLYRSAYLSTAKAWYSQHMRCCHQNKQQALSSLIGKIWAMESPELREEFKNYANIEKENDKAAHKSYKYSPLKRRSCGDRTIKSTRRNDPSRQANLQNNLENQGLSVSVPHDSTIRSQGMLLQNMQSLEHIQYLSQCQEPTTHQCCVRSCNNAMPWMCTLRNASLFGYPGGESYHTALYDKGLEQYASMG